ncbi:hypothetical protein Acr_01g0004850 [Actinidia rufa]|uniref:Uncharacterized protein n=1 Tax=Actinidia rufa TaxID=165716 RepID=A0A7J0E3G4_9ERIC|nr:hypothetical protein Acr_01g0004850 [Actinidia rufa]
MPPAQSRPHARQIMHRLAPSRPNQSGSSAGQPLRCPVHPVAPSCAAAQSSSSCASQQSYPHSPAVPAHSLAALEHNLPFQRHPGPTSPAVPQASPCAVLCIQQPRLVQPHSPAVPAPPNSPSRIVQQFLRIVQQLLSTIQHSCRPVQRLKPCTVQQAAPALSCASSSHAILYAVTQSSSSYTSSSSPAHSPTISTQFSPGRFLDLVSKLQMASTSTHLEAKCKCCTKRPAEQMLAYERTSRIKHEDKQSGGYEHYTRKEKASTGKPHVERGTRKVGVRDELKTSSAIKLGDKSGCTGYYVQERVRDV